MAPSSHRWCRRRLASRVRVPSPRRCSCCSPVWPAASSCCCSPTTVTTRPSKTSPGHRSAVPRPSTSPTPARSCCSSRPRARWVHSTATAPTPIAAMPTRASTHPMSTSSSPTARAPRSACRAIGRRVTSGASTQASRWERSASPRRASTYSLHRRPRPRWLSLWARTRPMQRGRCVSAASSPSVRAWWWVC